MRYNIYIYIGISKQVHEWWDEMGRIMATIVDKMMIHIDKSSACQMPHVIFSRQTQDGDMANQSSH
jgi:hypothetical protein